MHTENEDATNEEDLNTPKIKVEADVENELEDDISLVGKTVDNESEAYFLYKSYAHARGFGVRKGKQYYWEKSNGLIKSKIFQCNKSGVKNTRAKKQPNCKTRPDSRTSCLASIKFSVSKDGKWVVVDHEKGHNHALAYPRDIHLLRSARKMSESDAEAIMNMKKSGMRTCNIHDYIATEAGGPQFLDFTQKDTYNRVYKEKRNMIAGGDANALMREFEKKTIQDPMFFYAVDVDDDGRLRNFFWCDGRSILDYGHFGEVIVFDTSYRTNKYNLICAPLIGCNHHWMNIVFGCGFISSEDTESFVWLFEKFLSAMKGYPHPITIFTDGDKAMANAINVALPNTKHRLCIWHITQNISSHCPKLLQNSFLKDLFWKCVRGCQSTEEFEVCWELLKKEGKFENNKWLQGLYAIREKWSTTFNKDVCDFGIQSTQRSESTNNVLHEYCNGLDTLTECFLHVETMIKRWRENEAGEDFRNFQHFPVPVVSTPILVQASKFYTMKLFSMFQQEFLNGMCSLVSDETRLYEWKVMFTMSPLASSNHLQVAQVIFDLKAMTVTCTCKKWDNMRFLCEHALRALSSKKITSIPEKYLAQRWSKLAKEENARRECFGVGDDSVFIFRNHITRSAYRLAEEFQHSEEDRAFLLEKFRTMESEVRKFKRSTNEGDKVGANPVTPSSKFSANASQTPIGDPISRRPKGQTNKRIKNRRELEDESGKKLQTPFAGATATGGIDQTFAGATATGGTPTSHVSFSVGSQEASTSGLQQG